MPNYRELRVWRLAISTGTAIETAAKGIAPGFGELRDQLRRAGMSISTNIAEGADRGGDREFARFLRIALSSAAEAESLLQYAVSCRAMHRTTARRIADDLDLTRRMLRTLISVVEATHDKRRRAAAAPSDPDPAARDT